MKFRSEILSLFRTNIIFLLFVVISLGWAQPDDNYEWESVASMHHARSGHASVVYDGEIYVFGGQSGRDRLLNSLEIYDPNHDEWREGPSMPHPLFYHTATVVGEVFYFFGGQSNANRPEISIFSFSPNEGENGVYHNLGEMPEPLFSANSIIDDHGRILVMGGRSIRANAVNAGFYYDVSDNSTSNAPEFRSARANYGLVNIGTPLAIGGMNFGHVNSIEYLVDDGWTPLLRLDEPIGNFGSVTYGDTVMIAGGFGGRNNMPLSTVRTFYISDERRPVWTRRQGMQERRTDHTLITIDGKIYAIGGITMRMEITDTVERLSYPTSVENNYIPAKVSLISAWPNPTNGMLTFTFPSGMVSIKVMDPIGRILHEQNVKNGNNMWSWDARNLPAGSYYYLLESNSLEKSQVGRFVVLK